MPARRAARTPSGRPPRRTAGTGWAPGWAPRDRETRSAGRSPGKGSRSVWPRPGRRATRRWSGGRRRAAMSDGLGRAVSARRAGGVGWAFDGVASAGKFLDRQRRRMPRAGGRVGQIGACGARRAVPEEAGGEQRHAGGHEQGGQQAVGGSHQPAVAVPRRVMARGCYPSPVRRLAEWHSRRPAGWLTPGTAFGRCPTPLSKRPFSWSRTSTARSAGSCWTRGARASSRARSARCGGSPPWRASTWRCSRDGWRTTLPLGQGSAAPTYVATSSGTRLAWPRGRVAGVSGWGQDRRRHIGTHGPPAASGGAAAGRELLARGSTAGFGGVPLPRGPRCGCCRRPRPLGRGRHARDRECWPGTLAVAASGAATCLTPGEGKRSSPCFLRSTRERL